MYAIQINKKYVEKGQNKKPELLFRLCKNTIGSNLKKYHNRLMKQQRRKNNTRLNIKFEWRVYRKNYNFFLICTESKLILYREILKRDETREI